MDLLGLGLGAVAATWVGIAARITGGRPVPLVIVLLACVATVLATRRIARARLLLIAVPVAAAPLVVAVLARQPLLGSGPLGYANASGALFFMGASGAVMVALSVRSATARVAAYLVAALWILIPSLAGALAAALLGGLLALAVVFLRRPRAARVALLAGAGLTLGGLVAAAVLGFSYEPGERIGVTHRLIDATIDERRVALWSEALDLLRAAPLTGVGPGRFRETSPTARSDRDALWAHNEYLEVAAETGIPGLILMLALVLWGFARLWHAVTDFRSLPAIVALGGAALHANIDYVWHFPAVPLALAALVGAGSALADTHG